MGAAPAMTLSDCGRMVALLPDFRRERSRMIKAQGICAARLVSLSLQGEADRSVVSAR
jgi:hypothetical protein